MEFYIAMQQYSRVSLCRGDLLIELSDYDVCLTFSVEFWCTLYREAVLRYGRRTKVLHSGSAKNYNFSLVSSNTRAN